MQRINWIDWAKALAVISVVFFHLPQSQEWFYHRYLQACTLTIFFYISGYLKKDRGSDKENWRKYWHGLILPYIIYNVLVYPYWFVKYYMLNDAMPDLFSALKPIFGALLFEHENYFCEPLNGPLWYLPAILFMHVTIDLCRKTRYTHQIMITLCVISFFLYAANKYWMFAPNLTPMGIFRRLPYYYIGYVMGQRHLFHNVASKQVFLRFAILLIISLLLFEWHLHEDIFILHITIYYPINICFLFATLYGCIALNSIKSRIITNLSIGTLVIIGLHFPLITIFNFILEKLFNINEGICYHWYTAIPITLFAIAGLYPLIILAKHHAPIFIGKNSLSKISS